MRSDSAIASFVPVIQHQKGSLFFSELQEVASKPSGNRLLCRNKRRIFDAIRDGNRSVIRPQTVSGEVVYETPVSFARQGVRVIRHGPGLVVMRRVRSEADRLTTLITVLARSVVTSHVLTQIEALLREHLPQPGDSGFQCLPGLRMLRAEP